MKDLMFFFRRKNTTAERNTAITRNCPTVLPMKAAQSTAKAPTQWARYVHKVTPKTTMVDKDAQIPEQRNPSAATELLLNTPED